MPLGRAAAARVIGVVPGPDRHRVARRGADACATGEVVADAERDLAKIAVVERHLGTGRIGLGLVRGFGLRDGALASTIAHDAHNIVVVGMNDDDDGSARSRGSSSSAAGSSSSTTARCARSCRCRSPASSRTRRSPRWSRRAARCVEAARELGCTLPSPFQSLAFLALSVIPSLKITDRGLVDVDAFELVPLEV